MKLVNPKVEIMPQESGVKGIYKQIEMAGRTAYKSEDKITEDSAKKFVDMLVKRNHGAALEHGTVYLAIPDTVINYVETVYKFNLAYNKYTCTAFKNDMTYITTNYRVLQELGYLDLLKWQTDPTEEDFNKELFKRRVTVKFTCDRGISHEFVRHRQFSFLQESSRYCNYSKSKFGGVSFIIPYWLKLNPGIYTLNGTTIEGDGYLKDVDEESSDIDFLLSCILSERIYLNLLHKFHHTPQQARQVLLTALKTELIMTGTVEQWQDFFNLRCANDAHPDARFLANELKQKFINNNYLNG